MAVLGVFTGCGSPAADLAAEVRLLERAAGGECGLLLCSWPSPVVVLGYGQGSSDVDLDWCRAAGVPVLRRSTGGTGVVHCADLAVSLVLPKVHPWAGRIMGLYGSFLDALAPALRAAGGDVRRPEVARRSRSERSPICFEDQLAETLVVGGRKAVGCAQARRTRAVLVHAAVLLDLDAELWARVFRVPAERVEGALAPAVPGGDWQTVGTLVAEYLARALGLERVAQPLPALPRLAPP